MCISNGIWKNSAVSTTVSTTVWFYDPFQPVPYAGNPNETEIYANISFCKKNNGREIPLDWGT
jgi:hypothetical protein